MTTAMLVYGIALLLVGALAGRLAVFRWWPRALLVIGGALALRAAAAKVGVWSVSSFEIRHSSTFVSIVVVLPMLALVPDAIGVRRQRARANATLAGSESA
jgi:hypothetical protein